MASRPKASATGGRAFRIIGFSSSSTSRPRWPAWPRCPSRKWSSSPSDRERRRHSLGEKERDDEANSPVGPAARALSVVAAAERELDWQLAELDQLGDEQVDGHRPAVVLPVVCGLGVHAERSEGLGSKGEEGLQERGADVLAVVVAGERPDVVGQNAIRKAAVLPKQNGRRTGSPLLGAEHIIA